MTFIKFWAAMILRNADFVNDDTVIKIKIGTIKQIAAQAHVEGIKSTNHGGLFDFLTNPIGP